MSHRRVTLGLAGAALVAGVLSTVGASASTGLCVGGAGCYPTLQRAVDAARDGDTIHVNAGTFGGGVTITKSITIAGASASSSRISGGGPVVTIGSAATAPTVTVSDLTITGGLTTRDPEAPRCGPDNSCADGYASATALGGGIEAFPHSTVTLLHVTVTGNQAVPARSVPSAKAECETGPCPASFGDGAGIDVWGAMTLIDSAVTDNHAAAVQSNGGGITVEHEASLTLQGSQVTGNSASAAAPTGRFVSGGGIFVDAGASLIVDHSSIDGNTASLASSFASPFPRQGGSPDQTNAYAGGVFLNDGSRASITSSTLNGNRVGVAASQAQPYGADAALCACGNVPLTISNTTIDGNSVTVNVLSSDSNGASGGALESDGSSTTIAGTHIDGNSTTVSTTSGSAAAVGAVAFFPAESTAQTLEGSTVSGNSAIANAASGPASVVGAGLVDNGTLNVSSTTIAGNKGAANGKDGSWAQGGGVWNGQLYGGATSALTLTGSSVTGNVLSGSPGATLLGGGIFNQGGAAFTVALHDTVLAHNAPDQCEGC